MVTDYHALKNFGFSAFKAAEIELDAKRGDTYAKAAITLARGDHETVAALLRGGFSIKPTDRENIAATRIKRERMRERKREREQNKNE